MHIQNTLQAAQSQAAAAGEQLCLVVDTSHAEGAHAQLERWGVPYCSLFEGTPEEPLIEIAPLVIGTGELSQAVQTQLFAWAETLALSAPAVSWLTSRHPAQAMAEHLRHFHIVGLTEGQSMLLRWYDTRILPVLLACLGPAQAEAFTAGMLRWDYVDRFGQVVALPVAAHDGGFPAAPPFGEPLLALSDEQYGMLVDAADLDVLLRHLRQIIPDETRRVPTRTLSQFVSRHQQRAIQAGLTDIDRQTQYVLLALYTSGKAMEQPEFKAFISKPPATLDEFHKKMQGLSDAVWEAGPPLWEAAERT